VRTPIRNVRRPSPDREIRPAFWPAEYFMALVSQVGSSPACKASGIVLPRGGEHRPPDTHFEAGLAEREGRADYRIDHR